MRSFRSTTASATRLGLVIQAAFALLLLAAAPARVEPPTPTSPYPAEASPNPLKVTWQDIVRLVDQDPRLVAAQFKIAAARGAVDAAGAVPNPSLDATLGHGASREGPQSRPEWSSELTFPLGWIAQRGYKVDSATAEVDATLEEAKAIRRDVLLQLRVLFWNLAYDQARVVALEALESQTAELARSVTRRVEMGEARPSEKVRAEVELEKVTSELDAARVSLRVRQSQLRLWIATATGRELVIEADLTFVPDALELDTALAGARDRDPSLKAARARIRALAAGVDVEKMARLPSVALKGFTADELDRRAIGGGIVIDLPLWNWNSGRIAQAEAQLASGKKQLEAEAREIESSIIEAQGACLAASQTAVRYKDRILPRAESAASTMERTYQLGEASLLEVIDARRVLVETRRQYLLALVQAQIDCSCLNALAGKEDAL